MEIDWSALRAWLPWGLCAIVCLIQLAREQHYFATHPPEGDAASRVQHLWGAAFFATMAAMAITDLGCDVYRALVPGSHAHRPIWIGVVAAVVLLYMVIRYTIPRSRAGEQPYPQDPPSEGEAANQ